MIVDGVPYTPGGNVSIGVGVTTHNRPEVFQETIRRIRECSPGVKIVVVDDASTKPVADATFRFDQQAGIARAKNKCLELLDDCEHIFLFDDDCYPLKTGWWEPYVESPEPHLMYLFTHWSSGDPVGDSEVIFEDDRHVAHSHERGCMIYVHCSAVDKIGGMDPIFGLWGGEHGDWSNRIHAAGLTSFPYMDVKCPAIHSMDQHGAVASSMSRRDRKPTYRLVESRRGQPIFCEIQ